ncbi:MAG TPA: proline dehydrogenase family protein [Acidimicrobiia bacterium]|nr:proline dehydrogenase family protein [Acidimicrobiia bacterium]
MANAAPVEKLFTSTAPGRRVAGRFVAGETLDQAVAVAKRLNDDGLLVSLDLVGEEVHDRDSALAATEEYLESLDRIRAEGLRANISVKPTQLGLSTDEALAMDAIAELGKRASAVGTTVTIDMEDSRYTESTIRLFERGQELTGNFGVALQAYMRRTPADLERLIPLGGHIRLCKGAYAEPEDVALQTKSGVDAAYARQLRRLMEADTTTPAVATHDTDLLDLAIEMAGDRRSPFEFQMLYGVRRDLQRDLVDQGHPLRIYLPFGSQWYPYLTRRLAERPANALFLARALFSRG